MSENLDHIIMFIQPACYEFIETLTSQDFVPKIWGKFESFQFLLGHAKEKVSFDLQFWSQSGPSAFASIDHDLWKKY